jgi:hypothetical protein
MVRERLGDFWVDCIYSTFSNEPGLKDREVADRMQQLGKTLGRSDFPAHRTVTKYRAIFETLAEDMKAGYRIFRWPASIEARLLPSEASPAALELLGWSNQYDLPRPTVAMVRWYWWVSLAIPQATLAKRLTIAGTVAMYRESGIPLPDGLEEWLAYQSLPKEARAANGYAPTWDHRVMVATGGPSAAWATRLAMNPAAKAALEE